MEESLLLPVGRPGEQALIEYGETLPSAWLELDSAAGGELPKTLFGDSVVRLSPRDARRYSVVWPIRAGVLDVRPDQPLSVVLSAVEVGITSGGHTSAALHCCALH